MDALLRRRAMMAAGGGTPPAPLPYTPVEYIETDGTAYIDTGIKGNVTKSFEMYIVPVIPASGNDYVMGCRKDSGDTRFFPFLVQHTGAIAGYAYAGRVYNSSSEGVGCSSSASSKKPMYVRCSFSAGSQYFEVKQDGQSAYTTRHTTLSPSISTGLNILMFAADFYGTDLSLAEPGIRLYYLKIFSDANYTTLLFDGVPCLYEGEYGLWDKVTDSFFGNANSSGAFAGPNA